MTRVPRVRFRPRIAAVVEGHGEVDAVPLLLRRTLQHFNWEARFEIATEKAVRAAGSGSIKGQWDKEAERGIEHWVDLAAQVHKAQAVLVIVDADKDCPKSLGPALLERARRARPDLCIGLVLAKREYESWILSAWHWLWRAGVLKSSAQEPAPNAIEQLTNPKGRLRSSLIAGYSETTDQSALSRFIQFGQNYLRRVPSLGKWVREVRNVERCLVEMGRKSRRKASDAGEA